jgi:hypothetical protein
VKGLEAVSKAASDSVKAAAKRDDLIRKAHASGHTIRTIAFVTDLSASRIHQIIHHR